MQKYIANVIPPQFSDMTIEAETEAEAEYLARKRTKDLYESFCKVKVQKVDVIQVDD